MVEVGKTYFDPGDKSIFLVQKITLRDVYVRLLSKNGRITHQCRLWGYTGRLYCWTKRSIELTPLMQELL